MIRTVLATGLLLALGNLAHGQDLKEVAAAQGKAIGFLKSRLKDGSWEHEIPNLGQNRGGTTALATLALLESGAKANDPAVQAAMNYLKTLPLEHTYSVSLQTLCFCKADPTEFAADIQKRGDWLVAKARTGKNVLLAWGYPTEGNHFPPGLDTDMSNSHYAVEALVAATQGGARVDEKLWRQVQKSMIDSQLASGGWAYQFQSVGLGAGERQTMTAGAIACLALAQAQLPNKDQAAEQAIEKGLRRLGRVGHIIPDAEEVSKIDYK